MKRKITSILFLFFATLGYDQSIHLKSLGSKSGTSSSTYQKCVSFHITPPLRNFSEVLPKNWIQKDMVAGDQIEYPANNTTAVKFPCPTDPIVQQQTGVTPLDTTIVNFEGGNFNVRPDATGAAGPNNYVQGVNLCNFNVYDKKGNLLLSTDMTALGGTCYDDPIVMYDKFADRWLVSNVSEGSYDLTVATGIFIKTP
jgi:hypothetical protein